MRTPDDDDDKRGNPFAEMLGYELARVDEAPREDRCRLYASMEAINIGKLGPATLWRRPDGSFTVMAAARSCR
jgi:hypothetical protein